MCCSEFFSLAIEFLREKFENELEISGKTQGKDDYAKDGGPGAV